MPPDSPVPAGRLWQALATCEARYARRLDVAFGALGLTTAQARLMLLLREGPRGLGDLARTLDVAAGNVTLVVANLEKAGLVLRLAAEGDRRAARATLTPRGSALAEDAAAMLATLESALASGLTTDEQEILARLVAKLIATMPAPTGPDVIELRDETNTPPS